jgi:hypothetical protein
MGGILMRLNEQTFYLAYRNSLYEGFLSDKNSPHPSVELLKELKQTLDNLEPGFVKGEISIDELVAKTKQVLEQPSSGISAMWDPKRDLCIAGWMAVGAAILAAFVASGGTLIVGSTVAGVVISDTVLAAIVGGASAGTIACIAGSCGNC